MGEVEDKQVRVLIIEDNPTDATLIRELLESCDCVADVSSDGAEGLQMVMNSPARYKIVFLDLDLPSMNGITVLSHIKKLAKPPHVIIVSGSPMVWTLPESGYYGVVHKPVKLEHISSIFDRTH